MGDRTRRHHSGDGTLTVAKAPAAVRVCVKMIGVGRFLRSRFLKRLIQRDAGNEPRPQEAANVQFHTDSSGRDSIMEFAHEILAKLTPA